jgi:O-antigen/teichoic acid export membrane protein
MLAAYALSIAAALIASILPFLKTYGLPRDWKPKPAALYALARHNMPLAAADAIEWGTRRLDIAILGLFVSPATVGIYWVAQQLASLPQKLKSSFDPVLGPVITKKLEEGDRPAVARQISQVGFWILAAQIGIALALGIPGEALMGLIGPARDFVAGNGALAFLLLAEVLASGAVVSEAALVYVARHNNMWLSVLVIALQVALSVAFVLALRMQGYDELYQAAGVAAALAVALGTGSYLKARLARRVLAARVSIWRWPLVVAAGVAIVVGGIALQLPEWIELAFGIPAMLGTYSWLIWTRGFAEEDRILFRKGTAST